MKVPAIAAGSGLAAVMVFTALGPHAQQGLQRMVRNAVREWEAPLPPVARAGINLALIEVGIPMLSRRCAAPSVGPEAMVTVTLRSNAGGIAGGCPRPRSLQAVHPGVLVDAVPVGRAGLG